MVHRNKYIRRIKISIIITCNTFLIVKFCDLWSLLRHHSCQPLWNNRKDHSLAEIFFHTEKVFLVIYILQIIDLWSPALLWLSNVNVCKLKIGSENLVRIGENYRDKYFKFVGLKLDEFITWDHQISQVSSKLANGCFILWVPCANWLRHWSPVVALF